VLTALNKESAFASFSIEPPRQLLEHHDCPPTYLGIVSSPYIDLVPSFAFLSSIMNVNAVLEGTLSGGSSTTVALRIALTVLLTNTDASVRREAELQLSQAADADFVSVF